MDIIQFNSIRRTELKQIPFNLSCSQLVHPGTSWFRVLASLPGHLHGCTQGGAVGDELERLHLIVLSLIVSTGELLTTS